MKYSKIEELRMLKNISTRRIAKELEMSDTGYTRMIQNETCTVSVLEKIAKYFDVPITTFLEERETKIYAENSSQYSVEDSAVPEIILLREKNESLKNKLAETSEKLLEAKDTIIKLLTGSFNNDSLTDNEDENKKGRRTKVRGLGSLNNPKVQMLLNQILNHYQPS